MIISMIAAMADNRVIGKDNQMLGTYLPTLSGSKSAPWENPLLWVEKPMNL